MSRQTQHNWGGWYLDEEPGKIATLVYPPAMDYWLPVGQLKTSAEVLDWIAQVKAKSWAGQGCLAGLIHALDDCLNLQANFCPGGQEFGT